MFKHSERVLLIVLVLSFMALMVGCQSSYVRSAKIYLQQDDPKNAKEVLLEGAQATPGDPAIYYYLGKVHSDLKEWAQMNDAFNKAQELTDQYDTDIKATRYEAWRQLFNSAVKPFNNSDFAKALEIFQVALVIRPGDYETLKRIGLCYLQLEDFDNAEATFLETLEADTSNADIPTRVNLLNIYFTREDWQKVLDTANDIIAIDETKMGDVTDRMAIAYQQMDQTDKAIEMWDKVIALNPDVADYYYNKGRLQYVTAANMDQEEKEASDAMMADAAATFAQAVALNPEDDESRKFMINALFRLQDWQGIVDALEPLLFADGEVTMIDNPYPEVGYWQRLKIAYANLQMPEKARIADEISKKLEEQQGGA